MGLLRIWFSSNDVRVCGHELFANSLGFFFLVAESFDRVIVSRLSFQIIDLTMQGLTELVIFNANLWL